MARQKNRRQRAIELYGRIRRGPTFTTYAGKPFTPEEASRQVRLWADSWVVDELFALMPELRDAIRLPLYSDEAANKAETEKRARPKLAPHEVSCPCCRAIGRCHFCFTEVSAETRCTSGGCPTCCAKEHVHKVTG